MRRAALACLLVLMSAGPAAASRSQESILQDDPLIVYPRTEEAHERTFLTLAVLGVDRVRVSVFWNLVAPDANKRRKPTFGPSGPSWPGSYPRENWERYDRIVRLAEQYGVGLLFTPMGPAPDWAAGRKQTLSVYKPNVRAFRAFVTAVGRRYSGTYVDPEGTLLPRVDHWSLWNEPNFPSWLLPGWKRPRERQTGRLTPAAPTIYRNLVDAGWEGLQKSGHSSDVILLGETAPFGPTGRPTPYDLITPVEFIRELYCLDRDYRPFRSFRARRRGCPSTRRGRRRFRSAHPGLFNASGFAHHAYSLKRRPSWRSPAANTAPLGGINRLVRAYDRALFRWGTQARLPLWITEYGYQTVPDPFRGVSLRRQARWLSWAEFLAYRNPRVAAMAQFLLDDDAPDRAFPEDDPGYWRTWQSGLRTTDGEPKPAFEEYPFPIHVTPRRPRRGQRVRVFSCARPVPPGEELIAQVEGDRKGKTRILKRVFVTSASNCVSTRVRPRGARALRVAWIHVATDVTVRTRSAAIRIR